MDPNDVLEQADRAKVATKSLSRNAFALLLNTGLTSVLGAGFWILASRSYEPAEVGQDAALVAAMMFLAAISELNLGLALPRFLPQLKERSAPAVMIGYLASSAMAIIVGLFTVVVVPRLSSSLSFLGDDTGLAALFVVAVVLWNIFGVQDAVLTALRRASWIPVENTIFGVAKLVLMLVWANSTVDHGVFVSWVVPMALMVLPVNIALFKWAIPHHVRNSTPSGTVFWGEGGRRKVIHYVGLDYIASLLIQGSTTLMPLLVVVILGPVRTAYFYSAFVVVSAFDQLSHNVGLALTVEGAFEESALAKLVRHTFFRFGLLIIPGVVFVILAAPYILWFFKPEYADAATTVLRLLALGVIPQTVLNLYQAIERVRGNAGRVLMITSARFVMTFGLVAILGNLYGLAGVGCGWFIAHMLVMVPIIPLLVRLIRQP